MPRVCYDWFEVDFIEATCPYCNNESKYYDGNAEGGIIKCSKCKKKFKLGEQAG